MDFLHDPNGTAQSKLHTVAASARRPLLLLNFLLTALTCVVLRQLRTRWSEQLVQLTFVLPMPQRLISLEHFQ